MPTPIRSPEGDLHADFLAVIPIVERRALLVFRHLLPSDREEAVAEAVAAAFVSYVSLKARGLNPVLALASRLAALAVLRVKDDRHVGGRVSSTDVLSRKAQQLRGFVVQSLPISVSCPGASREHYIHPREAHETWLQDNTRTPVPDQAAFRIDWPSFLQTLSRRDRALASFLSLGHSAKQAARQFGISCARVTQLRQRWQRVWLLAQEELKTTQEAKSAA